MSVPLSSTSPLHLICYPRTTNGVIYIQNLPDTEVTLPRNSLQDILRGFVVILIPIKLKINNKLHGIKCRLKVLCLLLGFSKFHSPLLFTFNMFLWCLPAGHRYGCNGLPVPKGETEWQVIIFKTEAMNHGKADQCLHQKPRLRRCTAVHLKSSWTPCQLCASENND